MSPFLPPFLPLFFPLATNWGYGTAENTPAGVPEPATLLLLLAGLLTLLPRRPGGRSSC